MKGIHADMRSGGQRGRRVLVPPVWLVLILSVTGIYGMNLVYRAVIEGAWKGGIIGAALLGATLYGCGSALAASMWSHRVRRHARGSGRER